MGLFGGIVINVMRNNLSVGIVCMTVDLGSSSNNSSNNTFTQNSAFSLSIVSVLFPNYGRPRGHSAMNDEFENCPNEITSDEGYGEVNLMFFVGKIVLNFLVCRKKCHGCFDLCSDHTKTIFQIE